MSTREQSRIAFARLYKSTAPWMNSVERPRNIPADIERVECSEPCFLCGVRADVPCRHRVAV